MATYTYDPAKHFLIIGGVPITGFQDGSDIVLERDAEVFTKQVDIDGQSVTFNKTNNRMATLTFTLSDGNSNNDFLSGINIDFETGSGGVVPVMVKDGNGRSVATGSGSAQTVPAMGGGRESSGKEWVLGLGQTSIFHGGAEGA